MSTQTSTHGFFEKQIEVYLIYNVLLFSYVQQCDSVIIYMLYSFSDSFCLRDY